MVIKKAQIHVGILFLFLFFVIFALTGVVAYDTYGTILNSDAYSNFNGTFANESRAALDAAQVDFDKLDWISVLLLVVYISVNVGLAVMSRENPALLVVNIILLFIMVVVFGWIGSYFGELESGSLATEAAQFPITFFLIQQIPFISVGVFFFSIIGRIAIGGSSGF